VAEDGSIAGGPMYYMKYRLNMKWLAILFSVATIFSSFGTGSLPQINSISNSFYSTFGITHWVTGAVLSVMLAAVIIGGIKRIAKVTEKLVPFMAIIYFLGAISVILYNYQNVIPSLVSVFRDVFTGTAATGGFLGAGFAYAFNRGVNRGLFSNEAGQGSAPIAHAAAKAHEPVSEGIVAILEPFIDTIIICMLTGLTLLSSGVWTQKFDNKFQMADTFILAGTYDERKPEDTHLIGDFLRKKGELPLFTGILNVKNGIIEEPYTILHARSVAEEVRVFRNGQPVDGTMNVQNGKLVEDNMYMTGKSLLHSAPLTVQAFTRSWFGHYGSYIVSIGLFLFAFSTAISWSYYGDRAVTFIFGIRGVKWFRLVFVAGFFIASFTDTTILWTFSGITIAMMAIPNLIGILILHREMKSEVKLFWSEWANRYPGKKCPKD
jgi:AGCS family alanine or glycine:cation symporter